MCGKSGKMSAGEQTSESDGVTRGWYGGARGVLEGWMVGQDSTR